MDLIMDGNMTLFTDDGQAEVLHAKIVTMVCLFSISMLFSCLPLLLSLKWDWFTKTSDSDMRSSNKVVIGLLAFGGGVLFATAFMHLLPETDENIHVLIEEGELPDLPIYLAALLMCSGFFMMYLIEELVHMYIRSRENKTNTNLTRAMSIKRNSETHGNLEIPMAGRKSDGHNHVSHYPSTTDDDSVVSALRGLLIVLALSIHELFEGLAVGLESSSANVWYMFGAVSAHKYLIGFCIGVELLAGKTKRWLSILYIFTFSFVSALGIGVGILMVGGAGAADAGIASVVLQGIACGTLVYVVFFEVWRQDNTGILQFVSALLGFTLMVLLDLLVELTVAD